MILPTKIKIPVSMHMLETFQLRSGLHVGDKKRSNGSSLLDAIVPIHFVTLQPSSSLSLVAASTSALICSSESVFNPPSPVITSTVESQDMCVLLPLLSNQRKSVSH